MNDLWKIVVVLVEQMLKLNKPLFDSPESITIIVTDKCRATSFRWKRKVGDMTDE